ncbi:unnamed protein product [Caretta caretta]
MAWQASTCTKSPGSWTTRNTLSAYTDRTSHSSDSRSTNPVSLRWRRQRKGSIARAYSWPERGHPCHIPRPKLTGSVRIQLSQTRHSAEAYSTIPTPKLQEIPDQIRVIKDGAAQDSVGLVWVDHVCQHGP